MSQGHTIEVIAPPAHYRRSHEGKFTDGLRSFFHRKEYEVGESGERIYRSPFIPSGEALTGRILAQAVIALGALTTAWRVRNSIRSVDIIIGTVPALPTAMVAYVVAKLFKKPYVIDLRDAWPDLLQQSKQWNRSVGGRSLREKVLVLGPLQVLTWIVEILLNQILGRADAVIVTSSDLRAKLDKKFIADQNRVKSRVFVIRNVFPVESKRTPRTYCGGSLESLHVLYAGTIGRAQNLQNVIDAAYAAKEMGAGIKLRLVGGGAGKNSLQAYAAAKNVDVRFDSPRNASSLSAAYNWADTALVHLTDWSPLQMAVPSKTYELIESRIHISGVVAGETERIIRKLRAGDTVPPENPLALARLWAELSESPERLQIGHQGAEWVQEERQKVVPETLEELLKLFENGPINDE